VLMKRISKQGFSFILSKKGDESMEQVEYEIDNETLKVILPNEVDHCNTVSIRKEADLHIYSGRVKNVEFDFTNTKFMDSSGIGMIMGRHKLIKPLGGKIILTGVKDNVERIINVSGLYKLL
ncbi:MAG: anti-sigma factor antagonist, partial [Lachnospiraceae bacterium]|nr:anti-sigma factor antagonist [Lachnospiraceae bacterium]